MKDIVSYMIYSGGTSSRKYNHYHTTHNVLQIHQSKTVRLYMYISVYSVLIDVVSKFLNICDVNFVLFGFVLDLCSLPTKEDIYCVESVLGEY